MALNWELRNLSSVVLSLLAAKIVILCLGFPIPYFKLENPDLRLELISEVSRILLISLSEFL